MAQQPGRSGEFARVSVSLVFADVQTLAAFTATGVLPGALALVEHEQLRTLSDSFEDYRFEFSVPLPPSQPPRDWSVEADLRLAEKLGPFVRALAASGAKRTVTIMPTAAPELPPEPSRTPALPAPGGFLATDSQESSGDPLIELAMNEGVLNVDFLYQQEVWPGGGGGKLTVAQISAAQAGEFSEVLMVHARRLRYCAYWRNHTLLSAPGAPVGSLERERGVLQLSAPEDWLASTPLMLALKARSEQPAPASNRP
jgi:hypothetical protein